ncbi:arginase family protein [Microbacterium thalassium]|uniref:Arginase n=1 Tax=Microbacterium thalassium TaxID=362649 RepID=A0A7X0FPX4_9MICO|nr:arginase family protein [Microbacterium thalassium]MBB6391394.1 arginase [Microbacterium thalassium]GLK25121.1 arginase [Microbacterium thalassium]
MTRFIVVPQWQGSPSSRAMQLIDGAEAIAGDLPRSACTRVDVPLEAGEEIDTGVHRYSSLRRIRDLVSATAGAGDEPAMIVGGDCGVAVAAVARSAAADPDLALVWLDAHPDLHTPETSESGAFSGMALRAVLGEGADGLALAPGTVRPDRVIIAGARSFDPAEDEAVRSLGITTLAAADLADPERLAQAVAATGASSVHIHVALDVLDPADMTGVTSAEPFGVPVTQLVAAIAAVRQATPVAGSSIAGFAPSSPAAAVEDMGTILRVVGALA